MSDASDAEYKRMQQARARNDYARWKALAGSTSNYAALLTKTSPLMRDDGWDPVEYLSEEERDTVN